MTSATLLPPPTRRVRTPTLLQMETVECGAAALGIVLQYYKRIVPLEELRRACGVSRDGSKANHILQAARQYGLKATGYRLEPANLGRLRLPLIAWWNFNHFVVIEGFGDGVVFINDPAVGPRTVSADEFDHSYTGVVLALEPGPDFKSGGRKATLLGALRERFHGSTRALVYVVLAGLALVIPGLIIPTFLRVFVDQVLVARSTDWLVPLLIGMALTAALRAALTWLQNFYLLRLETKLALSTSSQFFWHVLRLPIEFFAQRFGGEIGSRVAINDDVAQLLSGQLATTMINVVLVAFYAILMFQYDVLLTAIGVSIAVLNLAALQFVSRGRTDSNQRLLQERGKFVGTAIGGLQMIETLKASGGESDFFARWSGYLAKVMNAQQELGVPTRLLASVPPLLSTINGIAILVVGSLRVINGDLTIGMLVAFQSLMLSFIGPFNELVNLGGTLQEVDGSLKRLDDVLRHDVDPLVDLELDPDSFPGARLKGYLELHGVSFGYSRLEPPLIENLDLTLKPGFRIALVGGSGSGKSTIAKLVTGLYRPWSGEILFDGLPRERIPRTVMNASVGLVDQEIYLFQGTIRDNLTLWDDSVSESDLIQASRDAAIHDDVSDRQGGYDFQVAEGGANFSGGQRQRLEIARALVANPTVLVLDEATSALDPATEKIIDDNLRRRGCTCVIVAHRLSTIRDADEIIVLERGKVVQRGTHDELYRVDGPYSRLIKAEAPSQKKPKFRSVLESLYADKTS
jgi:NHLM bacteriocin system ABC transporter peptidase/ATP-binding protein